MYSEKILDYFHNPRNVGEIEDPTVAAEAANPVCGDVIKLWVVVSKERIEQVKFKAQGCVPAVACGSWLTEAIKGRRLAEIAALAPRDVEEALGGLPPASRHAAELAIDTLKKILAGLSRKGSP